MPCSLETINSYFSLTNELIKLDDDDFGDVHSITVGNNPETIYSFQESH